ncbi:MAG: hypothetical protein ACLSH0_10115 [Mediterraneibacter faecis]
MNDLLIKVLSTVMVINAGMHFYYAYKKECLRKPKVFNINGINGSFGRNNINKTRNR